MGDSDGGKKRNGISRSLKRFFGVGDFGFSFMTNIETYYFTYFLTNIAEFSLPVVTMITTIASVVDAALSWICLLYTSYIKNPAHLLQKVCYPASN